MSDDSSQVKQGAPGGGMSQRCEHCGYRLDDLWHTMVCHELRYRNEEIARLTAEVERLRLAMDLGRPDESGDRLLGP